MELLFVALFTILLVAVFFFIMLKGTNFNININVTQKIDEKQIEELQALYDKDGTLDKQFVTPTMDTVLSAINEIMTGDTNGEEKH